MPRSTAADPLVVCVFALATRIARYGIGHTQGVLKYRLDAPEASACKYGGLQAVAFWGRATEDFRRHRRDGHGLFRDGRRSEIEQTDQKCADQTQDMTLAGTASLTNFVFPS